MLLRTPSTGWTPLLHEGRQLRRTGQISPAATASAASAPAVGHKADAEPDDGTHHGSKADVPALLRGQSAARALTLQLDIDARQPDLGDLRPGQPAGDAASHKSEHKAQDLYIHHFLTP
ncbi:hypothetical protein Xaut_2081 [Xanthobacter versatilis]|uniref:Uncharacterized protein n=1 Tax=Xanthobacter autotrophicus (strain ATCC BAA-1158 / Py2) TaxID=78245 RepID=A7IH32_XANP2|nr:hypothetical protein Xaut_2081 [Xanthobacter autotrophicus Py2]